MPRSASIDFGVAAGYPELLSELKTRIRTDQVRAAFAVTRSAPGRNNDGYGMQIEAVATAYPHLCLKA
jgi:hypothetical protein